MLFLHPYLISKLVRAVRKKIVIVPDSFWSNFDSGFSKVRGLLFVKYYWQLAVHFLAVYMAAGNICDTLRMGTLQIHAY